MSHENSTHATQPASWGVPQSLNPVATPSSGLSATTANLIDRLESLLSCARRLNNKVHGTEPKAVSAVAECPYDPDAPIARKVDNAHRLISEIDNELSALESRL